MLRRTLVLVVFVALACAAAPGATRVPAIAPGVLVGGVYVAGLTSEPARALLERAYARSLNVQYEGRTWSASAWQFGDVAAIDDAVSTALTARTGEEIVVNVRWSSYSVHRFALAIARRVNRRPENAQLVRVTRAGPVIRPEQPGVTVRGALFERELGTALDEGSRPPLAVPTRLTPAKTTRANIGRVIWIDRASNVLRLFSGKKLVHLFRVATGQAIYPTPAGVWKIVTKQRNPWWLPPDSPWARGARPIPPGPGNPLGTRWMGLSAAGVGIHGTPNASSIGYSVSHGCIRMHIPDAEWLFTHVRVGTPVYIS